VLVNLLGFAVGLQASLGAEPRFGPTELNKPENYAAARALVAARLLERTAEEWAVAFDAGGVWCPTIPRRLGMRQNDRIRRLEMVVVPARPGARPRAQDHS
jgi:crotonobetainyl-CoA:carnitine CoA-transferase CaiB-like acyl-CoA transferase